MFSFCVVSRPLEPPRRRNTSEIGLTISAVINAYPEFHRACSCRCRCHTCGKREHHKRLNVRTAHAVDRAFNTPGGLFTPASSASTESCWFLPVRLEDVLEQDALTSTCNAHENIHVQLRYPPGDKLAILQTAGNILASKHLSLLKAI